MSDSVTIVYNRITQYLDHHETMVGAAVKKATSDVAARAKTKMAETKSGKVYKRKGGKTHQASAPGEAPAIDDGDLAGSFEEKMVEKMVGEVKVTSDHAAYLELGTKYIAARPSLIPALEEVKPSLIEALEKLENV